MDKFVASWRRSSSLRNVNIAIMLGHSIAYIYLYQMLTFYQSAYAKCILKSGVRVQMELKICLNLIGIRSDFCIKKT